jgi:cell division septum initiation protein DivIVA
MTDIAREKYERLMTRVSELEDRVADLEGQLAGEDISDHASTPAVIRHELQEAREQLAQERSELSRLSDGCGKPHPTS